MESKEPGLIMGQKTVAPKFESQVSSAIWPTLQCTSIHFKSHTLTGIHSKAPFRGVSLINKLVTEDGNCYISVKRCKSRKTILYILVESRELQQNLLVSFAYILCLTTVIKLMKVISNVCYAPWLQKKLEWKFWLIRQNCACWKIFNFWNIQRAQTNISLVRFAHASVIFSLITVQKRNSIDEVKVQRATFCRKTANAFHFSHMSPLRAQGSWRTRQQLL